MRVGVPKEIKNCERRVSLTPQGARQLIAAGHQVCVQAGAGTGSGFSDDDYRMVGAQLATNAAGAWGAELVLKVKEPLASEYAYLRPDQCLFTYLHLAAEPGLAAYMLERKTRAIAYETVQSGDGSLPLLAPMSRVAGRVAVQIGASLLQAENGAGFPGKGVLMGGVDGVPPARVLILGGGQAGRSAAAVALGMGAEVCLLDVSAACVRALQESLGGQCDVRLFTPDALLAGLDACDLLIGAALIPGEHAPQLLDAAQLERMSGGVFVDIAIDQGGISRTSRPSSYAEPVYVAAGVLHCCLPNLPAAVPLSATRALTHATLPYVEHLAGSGIEAALRQGDMGRALSAGVNLWDGHITHAAVAQALNRVHTNLRLLLA
ncbi:MAG: alanine dehydrogenase [Mariprofundaceae bacterium]|nr:alanine dehydrogenase [Mariprofundaceae bacterium]